LSSCNSRPRERAPALVCAYPADEDTKSVPPHTMNQKELKELIEFLIEKDIAEFELERGDVKVRIKRGSEPVVSASAPDTRFFAVHSAPPPAPEAGTAPVAATVSAPPPAEKAPAPEEGLHIVRSPIVGTFYESPSPGSPPFVKPGDIVEAGQILCIVEAMKLMNEIESDVAGEIVKRLVENNAPIEYGQELFAIRPRK
jgi:acetyl-CoA carboxylase biotin carboxyl carrier protein